MIIFSVLLSYKLNHLKTLHLIWIRTSIFLPGLDRSGNIHKTYNNYILEVYQISIKLYPGKANGWDRYH